MNRVQMVSLVRVDGEFTPVSGAERHDGACEYVPGAISLVVDGIELLGTDLRDDVNWLWPFIVQALDECRQSGSGARSFPDQPIAFKAERAQWGGNVILTVTTSDKSIRRTAVAPSDELYEVAARAGLEFFGELRRLCGPDPASAKEEALLESWLAR